MKEAFSYLTKKKSLSKIKITKVDIEDQAKSLFRDFAGMKENTLKIFSVVDFNRGKHAMDFLSSETIMPKFMSGMVEYDPSAMEDEDFGITCVFKTCIEKILRKKISFSDFTVLLKAMAKASEIKYENENWSAETKILRNFDIDILILPEKMRNRVYATDEFILATDIISDMCTKLRPVDDGFKNYDEYNEYVVSEVKKLIPILQEKNLYSYQNEERLVVLLISSRHDMPMQDAFYTNIPSKDSMVKHIPTEVLRDIQKKLFDLMVFNNDDE